MTTTTRWRRNAALFLTGRTVSPFGSMIVQYAVMWWVTLRTRSGLAVALYAVAAFLPQGLVSIFGGVLADRMNRRVLFMIADGAIATATLVLAPLMANGVNDPRARPAVPHSRRHGRRRPADARCRGHYRARPCSTASRRWTPGRPARRSITPPWA
ncbi:MFS transporter [Spongiactinospora sp. TRM90649]|uniref:MFS transporter n=1 Tax=Spongiactinospora sp. TRM90649 TaxID=3031114 RepID=UPI0023F7CA5E|nr:MFS transporter [Spongiactinospora sp. TRM90649]MDF5759342.1 MFS transporter [Spongiactinospora sp. TRM90649]